MKIAHVFVDAVHVFVDKRAKCLAAIMEKVK
jgi:hypothetical protein